MTTTWICSPDRAFSLLLSPYRCAAGSFSLSIVALSLYLTLSIPYCKGCLQVRWQVQEVLLHWVWIYFCPALCHTVGPLADQES